jgi:hypothetical protein
MVNSIFPLGLLVQIVGLPGTCKSALIYEILRWFHEFENTGMGVLIENETKMSQVLINSIFNYSAKGLIFDETYSLEEWQAKIQYYIRRFRERMDGTKSEPGPGRIYPVGLALDSLMSKSALEIQEKGEKEGHFGRNFAIEAGSIKTFMQSVPPKLADMPMTFLYTNHLKPQTNQKTGHKDDHAPGGYAVEFQGTLILKTTVVKRKISTAHFVGRGIDIKVIKNSIGETDRSFQTRLLWWNESYNNEAGQECRRQRTSWDWGWSTVKFLSELTGDVKARVSEIVDLHIGQTGDATCNVWSKALDIKQGQPFSWTRAGEMIQNDPDMLARLRLALDINVGTIFNPGEDYREQQKRLKKGLP